MGVGMEYKRKDGEQTGGGWTAGVQGAVEWRELGRLAGGWGSQESYNQSVPEKVSGLQPDKNGQLANARSGLIDAGRKQIR